ncbi:YbjN domain-containing protein [Limnospira fusiformis CCALA 023]|jgi:hypothetical protein|uniref:YbjN domain-containing protein n=1 Tax=Limnospira platensis NIES-46 TaxID=1236695 RepID=A0A5M3SZD5_LIMPL|nr:hypothetical protein APPUASWS_018440 [Arthrospira platensis str. Paraca]TVU55520.1 MAG: YbjN domain-containing protein [Arthrospira sp. PLM2.Bin9]BDT16577.1 hypothetical protein N39L_63000 [Arthrospira platensis NIES-39]GCE92444.1 hypothetical protein NIES46_04840 [Arthrospira platensis NIES-46]
MIGTVERRKQLTENLVFPVERKFVMQGIDEQFIDLDAEYLRLLGSERQVTALQLTAKVGSLTYQKILQDRLFYITPEVLEGWHEAINLVSSGDVQITLLLSPVLLKRLIQAGDDPQHIVSRFWEWCDRQNGSEMGRTESWFALRIVNYRTLWDFVGWSDIFLGQDFQEVTLNSIVQFLSFLQSNQSETLSPDKQQFLSEQASVIIDSLSEIKPKISPEYIDEFDLLNLLENLINSVNVILENLVKNLPEKSPISYTEKKQQSESLTDMVINWFEEEGIKWAKIPPKENILFFKIDGQTRGWICEAKVREEEQQVIFYSILVAKVPESKIPQVAEFICRANYGLCIGNFEMDFGDGEIRYKTSIDVEGGSLSRHQIHSLIYTNVETVERYFSGLMMVMEGHQFPPEAIRQIEP